MTSIETAFYEQLADAMAALWLPRTGRPPPIPAILGGPCIDYQAMVATALATSTRSRINFLWFDMPGDTELLERLYDRFNARDIEAALATMHPDVMWANGLEGGHVHGHDGVRDYWTRQWAMMDSRAEPTGFSIGEDGTVYEGVSSLAMPRGGARPGAGRPRGAAAGELSSADRIR